MRQHRTVLYAHSLIDDECKLYADRRDEVLSIETRLLSQGYDMTVPLHQPRKKRHEVRCPNCDWEGLMSECNVKHFGGYTGDQDNPDMMGWDEWDDLVCPKCDKVVDYLTQNMK